MERQNHLLPGEQRNTSASLFGNLERELLVSTSHVGPEFDASGTATDKTVQDLPGLTIVKREGRLAAASTVSREVPFACEHVSENSGREEPLRVDRSKCESNSLEMSLFTGFPDSSGCLVDAGFLM